MAAPPRVLVASATREDESIWPSAKRVERVAWDFSSPSKRVSARAETRTRHRSTAVAERVAGLRAALSDPHGARARDRPRDRGRREDGVRERPRVRREELGGARGSRASGSGRSATRFPPRPAFQSPPPAPTGGWCSCPACARRWPGSSYTSRSRRVRTRAGQTGKQTRKPARRRAPRAVPVSAHPPAARSPRRSRGASRRGDRGASPRDPTHECVVSCCIDPKDARPGNTTVLRAPVDDHRREEPSCRESFRGRMTVSLWERKGRGWGSGVRGRALLTRRSPTSPRWRSGAGRGMRHGRARRRCASRSARSRAREGRARGG